MFGEGGIRPWVFLGLVGRRLFVPTSLPGWWLCWVFDPRAKIRRCWLESLRQ